MDDFDDFDWDFEEEEYSGKNFADKVLKDYGLDNKAINIHTKCSGLGTVSLGEISRLTDVPESEVEKLVQNLVEMGFFRIIKGDSINKKTLLS